MSTLYGRLTKKMTEAEAIDAYMNRVFARRSFQQSLTELEQEMRL